MPFLGGADPCVQVGPDPPTGRGTPKGDVLADGNVPTTGKWVTIRHCGLLPNHFGRLFLL